MSMNVPVIDLGLLPSSKDEQGKLKLALCSGGCFQAIGHGISNSFLNKVRGVAEQFFQLLQEEKQKYSRAGYDLVVKQVLDWNTRLFLRVFPEHQRKLNLWPENPDKIREVLHEYSIKLKQLVDLLFKAMAKSLALEENILLQDEQVEGLQFVKDEKWITVPVIPRVLVVNLGDQMQIMSNGIFKSPVHRVVTNTDKLRISVAMFNEVEPEKEIGPVEGLIDENRPRLYMLLSTMNAFRKAKYHLRK
ncbi:hypothetical protein ES288_D05G015800v1 [Gossypium darwinii]|uniref:Fe2OG dioxygenase domain-containing protein n=1 Tax=Gossypium darwinii TaxID=34276 RepID=A0A5D2CEQ3_GOSDA|nr:hypothetical protein ES288_D05G015800v1 [Gossypium darwinii]